MTLRFSGSVQKAFASLHDVLAEHPDFSAETLERIEDLSNNRPSPLATTFAMVVHVVSEAQECAAKTKDGRIKAVLDDVISGFAGMEDDRPVIKINRGVHIR